MTPPRWWPFLALFFLVGILFQNYLLTAFVLILAASSGFALWWRNHSLDRVTFRRKFHYRRGFPGEVIELRTEVENRKLLPLSWLKIWDAIPSAVGPEDDRFLTLTHIPEQGLIESVFSLRWFERDWRVYRLLLRKRGLYRVGPPRLESGDLFGLFEKAQELEWSEFLTVFPTPLPFEALKLPPDDPFGDRRTRRRLFEDPNQPMGVRDYCPEDEFRRVHWPATAHTGNLQVKVYQPVSAQVMVVCLNVSTFPRYWEGIYPALLEHLLRVSATVLQQGVRDGYRVGLISNGTLAHADQPFRVPPGRSRDQLAHLLTALAGVTPIVTGPFDRFLMSEIPHLPYGATLVVVTALLTSEIQEALLRSKQHGRRLSILYFGVQPPPEMQGIPVIHRPFVETQS